MLLAIVISLLGVYWASGPGGATATTYATVQQAVASQMGTYRLTIMNDTLNSPQFAYIAAEGYAHTVLVPTNQAIDKTLKALSLTEAQFLASPILLSSAIQYNTLEAVMTLGSFQSNQVLPTLLADIVGSTAVTFPLKVTVSSATNATQVALACATIAQVPLPCPARGMAHILSPAISGGESIVYIVDTLLTPPGWLSAINPSPPPAAAAKSPPPAVAKVPPPVHSPPPPPPSPSPPPKSGKKLPPPPSPPPPPPPKKKKQKPPPALPAPQPPPAAPPAPVILHYKKITQALAAPRLSLDLFNTALTAAGLVRTIDGLVVPATLFAPSDAAMTAALQLLDSTIDELALNSMPLLTSMLEQSLILGQALTSVQLTAGLQLYAFDGQLLTIARSFDGLSVYVNGPVNIATIQVADVTAGTIIIHVVDSVLLPPGY